jgi:hypothetical protein
VGLDVTRIGNRDPPAADVPLVVYHTNSVLVVIVGIISSVRASVRCRTPRTPLRTITLRTYREMVLLSVKG